MSYNMYYGGVNMISVRLTKEMENKIDLLSKQENITKSDIIKEAIEKYLTEQEKKMKPYIRIRGYKRNYIN